MIYILKLLSIPVFVLLLQLVGVYWNGMRFEVIASTLATHGTHINFAQYAIRIFL